MVSHTLFLLDGMALAYRAHFALIRNPILNSKGVNTSAIYGFANTLTSLIENESPTHIAVAFDTSAPTARHEAYPEYKAQRDAMPEELASALPNIKRLCDAMNIPVIEMDGYEADDIIGTLAKQAEATGTFHTYMVTPDKDFAQLVSENTSIWKPGRKGADHEVLGLAEILANWEIERPEQVIDILGLWGDSVDNIPGVPSIGEKTAKKLVAQYGSVEGLLANTAELKGKQREKVEANKEQALLSKELATIIIDVPVDLTLEQLAKKEVDKQKLAPLFSEWEFRTLSRRLIGSEAQVGAAPTTDDSAPAVQKTLADYPYDYQLIDTAEKADTFFSLLREQPFFCFDLETTGLNRHTAELLGIAFCWERNKAYYLVYQESYNDILQDIFTSPVQKIGHNLKYDLGVLLNHRISIVGPYWDSMLMHCLISPTQKHGMDALAESELGYKTIQLSELAERVEAAAQADASAEGDLFSLTPAPASSSALKKGKKELDMASIPTAMLAEYACEDVDITLQLAEKFRPKLAELGMESLYLTVEAPLLPVLTEVEMVGISISQKSLLKIAEDLTVKINALSASILKEAGREFNLNSPKQLGEVIFGELALVEKPKKTKTGQFITNEKTLSALAPKHQIVADILAYREYTKLKSTYVDALPTHLEPRTGKIHTQLHQLQTATGRLASSHPNLQNIPIRTEAGRGIRAAFVPRSADFSLLACDYSQIELRIMAAMSGDEGMIKAFQDDQDIHTATAAKVFNIELPEVTREMRNVAKMVNFGIIYGISAFGLSQRLNIPRKEASEIIEAYFEEYPRVKAFMDETVETAREKGYVETILGRRRYMPDLNSSNGMTKNNAERAAINTPIQGSGADLIKAAMIKVQAFLREQECETQMILQVHDELLFDLHKNEHHLIPEIIHRMESALTLPQGVPAKVEYGLGENWLAAH